MPEHLFQAAADRFPHVFVLYDADRRFLYVNPCGLTLMGKSKEEVLGRQDEELFPPEATQRYLPFLEAARQTNSVQQFEWSLGSMGSDRTLSITYVPVTSEEGVVEQVLAITYDITGLKRAERLAHESEQRFKAMAESMPQLVWTAQADGVVDYYNSRAVEYGGIERRDGGDWVWTPALHADDLNETSEAWNKAVITGQAYAIEHRVRMADGSYRWHLSRAHRVHDPASGTEKWFGTATDIHDMKLLEEAAHRNEQRLAVALESAERAVLARDRLVSMVSHDLRNPLAGLSLQLAHFKRLFQLQAADPMKDRIEQGLHRMDRQLKKMERTIGELLDMSRAQAGESITLERRELDLITLVRRIAEEHQQVATTHVLSLRAEGSSLVGWWDPDRIERVIDNLLGNAVKYSPAGSTVEVSVESGPDGHAVLRVRDQGVGIPRKDLDRVFEWFARGDNVQGSVRGTGVGLASARQIVELHGGVISVESAEGMGSVFTVRLPCHSPGGKAADSSGKT